MNIEKVKHEVLNNNFAIEYDNGDLKKLIKVLEYIFPKDKNHSLKWKYFFKSKTFNGCYNADDYNEEEFNTIPLSKITFDKEDIWEDLENSGLDKPFKLVTTLNDVIELRRQYPNDWDFAQKFDELISENR